MNKETEKANTTQAHQGDIFFKRLDSVPKGYSYNPDMSSKGRIVLAEGEVTGHFHAIEDDTTAVLTPDDKKAIDELIVHVRAAEGAVVVHPEHGPITLPPGLWQVKRQREYEYGSETREKAASARQIAD